MSSQEMGGESERSGESDLFLDGSVGKGGLGAVESVDVGLVVFLVVEGHDLLADVRLECIVRVGEIGGRVLGHFVWVWMDGDGRMEERTSCAMGL